MRRLNPISTLDPPLAAGHPRMMSSTEPARDSLYSRLEDVLGHEHADTLMKYLPNDRADEVATKGDLSRLESVTKADIGRLEASTKAGIGRLEASTKSDIGRLEASTKSDFERVDARFDRLEDRMDQMQRAYMVTVVSSMTALTAIFSLVVVFPG